MLVYNPAAGQRNLTASLEAIARRMPKAGLDLTLMPSRSPADSRERVRVAIREGAQLIAVCGGDGTINSVAVELAGTGVPLGILPAGTTNVLARDLEIPRSLPRAADVLVHGVPLTISLGLAGQHRFLMMAGFGFDAVVMSRHSPFLKRWFGRTAIAARCAEEMLRFSPPGVRVRSGSTEIEGSLAIAANIRLYGGEFIVAPEADPTDDVLDIVVFRGSSRADYARYFAAMLQGRLHRLPDVVTIKSSKALIEASGNVPVPGQVDGDTILQTPVEVSVEPRVVTVLVPRNSRYVR
ncbi:MAG: diacylglycerol kinase family protein [Acidobacteriota bacterium]